MRNNSEIKAFALESMNGKWVYGIQVVALSAALCVVPEIPKYFMDEHSAAYVLWHILTGILVCAIPLGIATCFLDVARHSDYSCARVFAAFRSTRFFFKIVLMELLKSTIIALWSLLLIVPGILKYYSYSMAELIITDHPEYSPFQALAESKKMMYGHRMELFRLQLAFLPWLLLTLLTIGIASLWVSPYYNTAKSKFYLELKRK